MLEHLQELVRANFLANDPGTRQAYEKRFGDRRTVIAFSETDNTPYIATVSGFMPDGMVCVIGEDQKLKQIELNKLRSHGKRNTYILAPSPADFEAAV